MPRITLTIAKADRLLALLTAIRNHPLPWTASYRTRVLARKIRSELKDYHDEFRRAMRAYGKRDKDGRILMRDLGNGMSEPELEDEAAFHAAIGPLREQEITVEHIELTEELFGESTMKFPAVLLDELLEHFEPHPQAIDPGQDTDD